MLGATFRSNEHPRHIWVVLSDPARTHDRILFVCLTTLRDTCPDDECILGPEDYRHLRHRTAVAFSRAIEGRWSQLEQAVRKQMFAQLEP